MDCLQEGGGTGRQWDEGLRFLSTNLILSYNLTHAEGRTESVGSKSVPL